MNGYSDIDIHDDLDRALNLVKAIQIMGSDAGACSYIGSALYEVAEALHGRLSDLDNRLRTRRDADRKSADPVKAC